MLLTTSFIVAPDPSGPSEITRLANASSAGRAWASAASSPPAITSSWPLCTVETLPETGVSISVAPVRATSPASAWIVEGSTVLVSVTTVPARSPATSPSGPR